MKKISHKEKLKGNTPRPIDDLSHPDGVPEMVIVTMAGTSHPEIYVSDRIARILSQALKDDKILLIDGSHHELDSRNIVWTKEKHEMKWIGSILENESGYNPIVALKMFLTEEHESYIEDKTGLEENEIPF